MPSSEVMHKFGKGQLHSGSKHGPKVTSRDQAIAIKMSEERTEKKHGGHYPDHKSGVNPGGMEFFGDDLCYFDE